MKHILGYILIVFGVTLIPAMLLSFVLCFPIGWVLKDIEGETIMIIKNIIINTLTGFLALWFSVLLFSWLDIKISLYIPIILSVLISIWNFQRVNRSVGSTRLAIELSGWAGNLIGIFIGTYYFIMQV